MDVKESFLNIKHLYNRMGFGLAYPELTRLSKKKFTKVIEQLVIAQGTNDDLQTVNDEEYHSQQALLAGLGKRQTQTAEEKQQRVKVTRMRNEKSRQLNVEWIKQMINTSNPLLEKMTLFWHGHFACRSNNPFYAQQLNNIQRKNALGNFKTLLMEVSKSPAMLDYLNNQQNRKNRPNENFARELMELFTLGRGNYIETDIKEAARAFTGWAYNKQGEFEFKTGIHDERQKTFFGKTGNFDGEAIIDMILARPETATFICRKLYLFFVSDIPDESHVEELADHFYKHQYNITSVITKLCHASWFYSSKNVGNKIKSPVELLVGMSREFRVTYRKPRVLTQLQSSLGQYLFNPPNVAGWPGGKNWIDSSSLMLRLKIPSLVLNDGILDFSGKTDPEDEAVIALNSKTTAKTVKSYVNATANWDEFLGSLPKDMKKDELATFLLASPVTENVRQLAALNPDLKNTAITIASIPEYQLC